jgi:dCTP deaminase
MILSNAGILHAIRKGEFRIGGMTGNEDAALPPFNTTAVDLRIDSEIVIPQSRTAAIDLRRPGIREYLRANSDTIQIRPDQPYSLDPGRFVLAQTREVISLPVAPGRRAFNARVEGKSSIARCGVLVHFTAPTIHAGFEGTIALELVNLGVQPFLLYPDLYICQLLFEPVEGEIVPTVNQFRGQRSPTGGPER